MAQYCTTYLKWYENLDYHITNNGELHVLQALSSASLKVIFDVGANVGEWTVAARAIHPAASIHCFEIVEETRAKLRQQTEHDPAITVCDYGLLDACGEIEVKTFAGQSDLATIYGDYPHLKNDEVVTCKVSTGDQYVREHDIERIDFLKMDVEGAEGCVLRGFERTIAAGRIAAIQFEYGQPNLVSGIMLRELYRLLMSHGYKIGKIYPNYVDFRPYHLHYEDYRAANYLAVRSERADLIELLQ
jgi:FkbM family methyltransferase